MSVNQVSTNGTGHVASQQGVPKQAKAKSQPKKKQAVDINSLLSSMSKAKSKAAITVPEKTLGSLLGKLKSAFDKLMELVQKSVNKGTSAPSSAGGNTPATSTPSTGTNSSTGTGSTNGSSSSSSKDDADWKAVKAKLLDLNTSDTEVADLVHKYLTNGSASEGRAGEIQMLIGARTTKATALSNIYERLLRAREAVIQNLRN